MKILLVEDDSAILTLVHELFFDAFKDPILTNSTNGSEGLLACMKTPFDLIVTDYQMPVMNGLDFVSILRKCNCANQLTPVIFLSGFVPLIQDSMSTFENVHFMEKPVQVKRFLNLASMLTKQTMKKAG